MPDDHLGMTVSLLPQFPGPLNSLRAIIEYIVDPTNAALISIDEAVAAIIATLPGKIEHHIGDEPPESATRGWLWTHESTGGFSWCHESYETGEPIPSSFWTAITDASSRAMVQVVSQLNSPTPQVPILLQTIQGIGADGNLSASEKPTVKIVYDELVARKAEIDINAVRYDLSGSAHYLAYVSAYTDWKAYIDGMTPWTNLATDTAIASTANWDSNWSAILSAESNMLVDIRAAAQDLLDTIDGNTTSVLAQLDEMTSDGAISPTEKLRYREDWLRIQEEYSTLEDQATEYEQTAATTWVNLAATYEALRVYLATTTTVFSDMATATVLADEGTNATEWQAKWQAYYADSKIFDAYIQTYFKSIMDAQDATLQGFIDEIQALSDDGIITGGTEKQTTRRLWLDITRLHSKTLYQAGKYSVATPANYTTSYDALSLYLNTTIDLFTNLDADTAINRAIFNSKFEDYYFNYDTFTDLIVDAQRDAVDSEPADYEDYKALIDAVVDDGIVSAGMEKTRFNAIWLDIQATQAIIVAKATNAGASTTGLVSAYDALSDYIGTLTKPGGGSPNFTIEGEDSAIGISTFHGYMRAYESAKAQLESDIISKLIELQAGNARTILDMNDDGIISVSEKGSLYKDWQTETAEKAQLDAQATLLSITTEKTNMDSAYTTLETFLNGLQGGDGLFNNMAIATTLTTPQKDAWDGHWNLYFTTKATLQTTIIATVQGNTAALGTSAFRKDGSVAATGNFDMADYSINNIIAKTLTSASKWAATNGQVYTEQQARIAHNLANNYANNSNVELHGIGSSEGNVVATAKAQTLTNKTINADNNTISELQVDNLKAGTVEIDVMTSTTVDDSTLPSVKATKKAVNDHAGTGTNVHGIGATASVVGTDTAQTLTNKTLGTGTVIDFDNVTASNIEVADLKSTAVATSIGTPGVDTKLATEKAVRDMYASVTSAIDAAVAAIGADFGCHRTDIQTGTNTSWTTALIGTRIDTSSPSYAASTFNFAFEATMGYNSPRTDDAETVASYVLNIRGFIKKAVSSEPYCYLILNQEPLVSGGGADASANTISGTLTTSGTTLTADFDHPTYAIFDNVSIERVDSSNELCFRLACTTLSITDFNAMMVMTGPRKYTGTLITSSNGTEF